MVTSRQKRLPLLKETAAILMTRIDTLTYTLEQEQERKTPCAEKITALTHERNVVWYKLNVVDFQIARIIEDIRETPQKPNTLFHFISDKKP